MRQSLRDAPTVTEAIYETGFNSNGRFYADSDATLGMTPGQWRRRGAGERIRYTLASSPLGPMLVALTRRGVCAIDFADDGEALAADLSRRFPRAEIVLDDAGLAATVAALLAHLGEPRRPLDLPLDVRGTAFQHRVWRALRAIEPGRTVSYRELATTLGQPNATRAVARACAGNPLALAIPCHRVIASDGALRGYRWGLARKRALLESEATAISGGAEDDGNGIA